MQYGVQIDNAEMLEFVCQLYICTYLPRYVPVHSIETPVVGTDAAESIPSLKRKRKGIADSLMPQVLQFKPVGLLNIMLDKLIYRCIVIPRKRFVAIRDLL